MAATKAQPPETQPTKSERSPRTGKAPQVTAIISAMTDAERPFVPLAVQSVLDQDVPVAVVVFMRDTCTWASEIERQFPTVRVERIGPTYLGGVRNLGARLAETPWLAYLDGDDEWAPGKLRAQLDFAHRTGADLVGCDHVLIDEAGRPFAYGIPRNIPMPSSWLIRRESALAHPFADDLAKNEDGEWWTRCGHEIRIKRLAAVKCRYRVRPSSLSSGNPTKRRKERYMRLGQNAILRPFILAATWTARRLMLRDHYVDHPEWQRAG